MFVSWFLLVIIALLVLSQHANNKDLQNKLFWANKDLSVIQNKNKSLHKDWLDSKEQVVEYKDKYYSLAEKVTSLEKELNFWKEECVILSQKDDK